ncbi:hypothetical protein LOC67_23990 [Stieleria sp. JC731]|uniref:hypothetical protein n=1 Tax=Pirellulaceae TaxID=2691357 RepID=UPI001E5F147F|nr:hypothetical protein [Stieleria sp. JC731]MCC9603623.1 hypothetical protein [Stieleria sp. JC731]
MSAPPIPWKHIRNVLVLFAPIWIGAVLIFGFLGGVYALLSEDIFAARQPLVVRDEATRAVDRLGRFASQTELKAAQETILEMAQNREVVAAALRQIGPPEGADESTWPTISDVDGAIKKSVNILAPQGAEFGNTEVVYLAVKADSPERAIGFCRAMFDNLTKHLRDVRRVRADSVIIELSHARDLAKANLDRVAQQMHEIEVQFGADLGELRKLNDTYGGDSNLRRILENTKEQQRIADLELKKMEALYELLVASSTDPQRLLISGGDLLTSQPSLLRLKDGLIDAQLKSSQLSGIYTMLNPKRRAALATEREIRERIVQETLSVIAAMEPSLKLQKVELEKLNTKVVDLSRKLEMLATARTSYAEIDAELKQRTEQLSAAEQRLADARANRSAALATNLVAELGPPQVSENPIGPGTVTTTFGAMMAGLIFGLGTVFLVAPGPAQSHGRRRWSDHVQTQNRRAGDQSPMNRRASDRGPEQQLTRRGDDPSNQVIVEPTKAQAEIAIKDNGDQSKPSSGWS